MSLRQINGCSTFIVSPTRICILHVNLLWSATSSRDTSKSTSFLAAVDSIFSRLAITIFAILLKIWVTGSSDLMVPSLLPYVMTHIATFFNAQCTTGSPLSSSSDPLRSISWAVVLGNEGIFLAPFGFFLFADKLMTRAWFFGMIFVHNVRLLCHRYQKHITDDDGLDRLLLGLRRTALH